MASLDERSYDSGKVYRVIWREHGRSGPREIESGLATKTDATRFKKAVEAAGNRWPEGWVRHRGWAADLPPARTAETMFKAVSVRWLDTRTRIESDQWARYLGTLTNRSFECFHDMDITDIGPDEIAAWILAQLAAGYAPKTITNKHGMLFGIFR